MIDQPSLPPNIREEDLEVTFSRSKRATVKKVFVDISGNFNIKHIEKVSDAMQLVLNDYDQITLRLNLQQIDLSAVQLLYNCLKKGEGVTLEVELPPVVRQLMAITGFSEMFQKSNLSLTAV